MLVCIERINEYAGDDKTKFFESRLIQDAVVRNLQILTESSQRIHASIKTRNPDLPWREMSGFRNILVHDYLGIDLDVIWSVIAHDLPKLAKGLETMLATSDPMD